MAAGSSSPSDRFSQQGSLREPAQALALYHLFKWSTIAPLFYLYFRGRVEGQEHVPMRGPVIAVSNHASDFDPVLLACALRRPVAFMAKEELFRVPVLKQAIALYGAYPVRRGMGDRQALKAAMSFLEKGWAAGLFLDGTRTADGRIDNPRPGAAWIAAKMQVPLLPVCLWGTQHITERGKIRPKPVPITIRIGELIPPPASTQREQLETATSRCADMIHRLHDQGH